jgi:hypothetical protein
MRKYYVRICEGRRGRFPWSTRFLLGVTNREDALGVLQVLPKRLGKFGLPLHPEKTRLIDLVCGVGTASTTMAAGKVS